MIQIFTNTNFDFVGKRRWFYATSLLAIAIALAALVANRGLNYGIDFSGGALVQVRFERAVNVAEVRRGLEEIKLGNAVIQEYGDAQEYVIRLPQGEPNVEQLAQQVQGALQSATGAAVELRQVEFVGPQVGRDLQLQAVYAVLFGMAGILVYVAIRFDYRGGVVSILAITHDVIVAVGALVITNREMSLPVLAGLLTIVGYSINNTVVIFDRIRETRGRGVRRGQGLADLVNTAINQTLSRTVLTAFTTFTAALVLFLFGGEVLNDFAFVLVVGVVTGTYSSIAAAALVLDWELWSRGREHAPRKVPAKA
jgi:preprotein translocase subunit SecF